MPSSKNLISQVEVYRNLHYRDEIMFSIRVRKTKRVEAHANNFYMKNCEFVVSSKGRERVLRERKKNVHAFIRGVLVSEKTALEAIQSVPAKVYYDPYTQEKFTAVGLGIKSAAIVKFTPQGVFAYGIELDNGPFEMKD